MQRAARPEFDTASIEGVVGPTSYRRGVDRFRSGGVLSFLWDDSRGSLRGRVRGSAGETYDTKAYFTPGNGGTRRFEQGVCSCPVAVDCKHAVALTLHAARALGSPESPQQQQHQQQAVQRGWAESLEALLAPAGAASGAATPLGVELTLSGSGGLYQSRARGTAAGGPLNSLNARLVRPGKNGGWVGGSLGWSKLHGLALDRNYDAEQVRVLQELYAAYRSRAQSPLYTAYSYSDDRAIDLASFESRQLWPLLDEAAAAGLTLVYGNRLGTVPGYGTAEVCLDVTRGPAGQLLVSPAVQAHGADPGSAGAGIAAPVMFIGTQAHGVVYLPPGAATAGGDPAGWRFRLARLARPVPPQLQRMALAGQRLEIPSAEQERFGTDFYPRLRRAATVTSSDGSYASPVIEGPVLVLRAAYGGEHDVDVAWDWAYQVSGSPRRAPAGARLAGSPEGYRDTEAERALLGRLDLPLEQFGLRARGAAGGGQPAPARLRGIDTMRFTTELLPLLDGQPDVRAEISGEPADYREASDSLRIEFSATEITGESDWFDLGLSIWVADREVPFRDVFVALSQGESHLILDDGAYLALDKPELATLARLIGEAQALADHPGEGLRISRFQAGLWEELTELGVVGEQSAAWQRQVGGLLSLRQAELAQPPPGDLGPLLRPYQLDGFHWLAFLWRHRLGGILADDMGLGKTLQTLAMIAHVRESGADHHGAGSDGADHHGADHHGAGSHGAGSHGAGEQGHDGPQPPFLIVAPTSVVPNWAAESDRFTPGLRVRTITGTRARRGRDLAELTGDADVIVTSYTLLRLDFEEYAALGWSGLILDEAQHVKNHQSRVYQCARRLPAPVKVAITGTPMENNLMELWSLLSITAPGLFPSPQRFRDYFARPIEAGGHAELLARLRRRIRPLVMRRTKEQVAADLPEKQQQLVEVELHPRHRRIYDAYLQRERQKVLGLIDDLNAHRFAILRSLTLLRQLSLHAGLVDAAHDTLPSGKVDALLEQLEDVVGGGHRALVFSQFTGFLRIVRERLDEAGMPYCYLDGQTRDRAKVLHRFRTEPVPVFLISLKAGGTGLNLAEADYCFLLDPWWNPATEAQAVDRAHRIGQTRKVMVYRLIARDTIEEKVVALQARKAELFASVMDADELFSARITADDIRGLFDP